MSVASDITAHAKETYGTKWEVRDGNKVPDPQDLRLSNDAVNFKSATVIYADLDGSTGLVENHRWEFSGQVYKTFLYAASRLIRRHGGSIVSYDGDRVMGVFISENQCDKAVSCGLEIHYAVKNFIQPEINRNWKTDFELRHVVGIDKSQIRAARTGVRGDNDLVWIGNAANFAAKLTGLSADKPMWITKRVYDCLSSAQKIGSNNENIWRRHTWSQHDNDEIYSTTYFRDFT